MSNKPIHTWMDTLPFDVHEQSNNFLIAITKNRRYNMWVDGYTDIDELEAKLFQKVYDEIQHRIHIGIWHENTSTNISSVSSQEGRERSNSMENTNIGMAREGKDN